MLRGTEYLQLVQLVSPSRDLYKPQDVAVDIQSAQTRQLAQGVLYEKAEKRELGAEMLIERQVEGDQLVQVSNVHLHLGQAVLAEVKASTRLDLVWPIYTLAFRIYKYKIKTRSRFDS